MERKSENSYGPLGKRVMEFVVGIAITAVGVNFAKMSNLGISPGTSAARSLEAASGLTLGTTSVFMNCLYVAIALLLLKKDYQKKNFLGIPFAFMYGFFVDLFGIDPNAFGHLLLNFPRPEAYLMRLLYLAVSIVIIGFGVWYYLKPQLLIMPVEELAQALSARLDKPFGDMKTLVDSCIITLAILIQLIFLGGFRSFTGDVVVVREGTILSGILVGQTVKLINRIYQKQKGETK